MESKPVESVAEIKITSHPLQNSSFVGGRYEILELIGQGGAGAVYKVKHQALNKIFALKALNSGVSTDEKALRRFDAEAKTVGNLSSPYLIQVHDYGVTDSGIPYLVLDYIEGTNLADEIARLEHLDESRVLALFSMVCEGLQHAHANQIVHRDLKPSNIMLLRDEDGNEIPKIVDFGIAKRQAIENSVTQTGEIFGTPLYMSPEQCLGKPVDARSDIYSLGCVMYEALTGVPPLAGVNPVETVLRHINDAPVPLRKACGDWKVSAEMEQVVMSCIDKDAKNRPESASLVQKNLEGIARGDRPTVRKTLPRLKSTHKVFALAFSSFILGGILFIGALFAYSVNQSSQVKAFDLDLERSNELILQKQYSKSVDFLSHSLEVSKNQLSQQQLINAYLTLNEAYSKMGDEQNSDLFFDKAMRLIKATKDSAQAFLYYYRAGDKASDPLRKISMYEEAISLWPAAYPNQPDHLLYVLARVVKQYAALQMWDKAADKLEYARTIVEKNPQANPRYKMQIADWSGYVFMKTGQFDRALQYISNAEQIARETKMDGYAGLIARQKKYILRVLKRGAEVGKINGPEYSGAPTY
jgi:serine/threonine protein kinase